MSHLQPRFIAKAKAEQHRAGAPVQLPRKVIRSESEGRGISPYRNPKKRARLNEPGFWYFDYTAGLNYLQFSLKKGK